MQANSLHGLKECFFAAHICKMRHGAAGEADIYPRFGRTMEWDTAAGHAILNAAGGCLTLPDGKPLRYGKPGFDNPSVVAWGSPKPRASS